MSDTFEGSAIQGWGEKLHAPWDPSKPSIKGRYLRPIWEQGTGRILETTDILGPADPVGRADMEAKGYRLLEYVDPNAKGGQVLQRFHRRQVNIDVETLDDFEKRSGQTLEKPKNRKRRVSNIPAPDSPTE